MADSSLMFAPAQNSSAPTGAAAVARGICRLFARCDIWAATEVALRNGRRTDLTGVDARGHIIIVEIKTARGDLLGDQKWTEYLDFCDKFYWAVPFGFDTGIVNHEIFMPERCGLIVADAYDAEIVRSAATHALSPARRKVETTRLARLAMRRLSALADPGYNIPFA